MRIKIFITALFALIFSVSAHAQIPLDDKTLTKIADNIGAMTLEVRMTDEKITWPITQTEIAVFMGKLQSPAEGNINAENLFNALPEKDKNYKGITVILTTRDGKEVAPLHVFEGNIRTQSGGLWKKDAARKLEYWLFGTAKVVKQQMLALQVLPIFTFNQCRLLGNIIVETQPRQCLMTDNNLIFDVPEKPTANSLKIKDFDTCLEKGEALIHTFPRRCMAKGGRVFTEPPRLLEKPQFSLMKPVGKMIKSVSETETIEKEVK